MPDDPKLKALLSEVEASIRRYVGAAVQDIVDDAIRRAVEARTEQVIQAFRDGTPATPAPAPPPIPSAVAPKAVKAAAANGAAADYGTISKPIRRALMELRSSPGGVSANDVRDYCRRNLDAALTIQQIRSILKVFARRGDATRLERGRYTAGPKLLASESGQPDMWRQTEPAGALRNGEAPKQT